MYQGSAQLATGKGNFTQEMERAYYCTIADCARSKIIDNNPDIVIVNDPQPLGLARHLKKPGGTWLWRCHIDIEETPLDTNPGLWDFMTMWIDPFDAAIFSAAHYVVTRWPLPNFIIPPFIDPISEKNRKSCVYCGKSYKVRDAIIKQV